MKTDFAGWTRWKGEMRGSFSLWGNNIIFTIDKSRKCCSPTQNNLKRWFSCTSYLWLLQGWTWAHKVLPGRRDKSCSVLSNVLHTYLSFWLWSEIWEYISQFKTATFRHIEYFLFTPVYLGISAAPAFFWLGYSFQGAICASIYASRSTPNISSHWTISNHFTSRTSWTMYVCESWTSSIAEKRLKRVCSSSISIFNSSKCHAASSSFAAGAKST